MSGAHTPGPWTAKNISGAGWGVWADLRPALGEGFSKNFPLNGSDALKNQLIQISYETWVQFPSEAFNAMQGANMTLMAAAPELLEALKVANEYLAPRLQHQQNSHGAKVIVPMIQAAIAKASALPDLPTSTQEGV